MAWIRELQLVMFMDLLLENLIGNASNSSWTPWMEVETKGLRHPFCQGQVSLSSRS